MTALYSAPVPINTDWSRHVFILSIVMPVLATAAVVARFFARRMKRVPFGLDGWLIVAALISYYFHCVVSVLLAVLGGAGHPIDTLDPRILETHLKLLMAVQIAYAITLGLIKCSVCALLIRIFAISGPFKTIISCVMALTVVWAIMTALFGLLSCRPFSYNWDKAMDPPGKCNNLVAEFAAVAAIDITVDLVILSLPMPKVWALHMPLTTRLALVAVFGLGLVDLAMGCMRIVADLNVNFAGDWTYTTAALYFWSSIEPGLAIVIACAIVLRPVLERILPDRLLRITRGGSADSAGGYSRKNSRVSIPDIHGRFARRSSRFTTLVPLPSAPHNGPQAGTAVSSTTRSTATTTTVGKHPTPDDDIVLETVRLSGAQVPMGRSRDSTEHLGVINVHHEITVEGHRYGDIETPLSEAEM